MARSTTYELVRVGRGGRKLHVLDPVDPNGRVFCETRTVGAPTVSDPNGKKHRTQDGSGGYSDLTRWSEFFHTGKRGSPTCSDCLALVRALRGASA
jgi:hypothetical protein